MALIIPSHNWKPEDLSLIFVTCPRKPPYFATTLASALLGDPRTTQLREIMAAVDAPDLACVAPLTKHQRIRWVARTSEENARVEPFRVHRRACHSYWRALGLVESKPRAVIVCEDDLIFRDGWLGMLLECLNEMQARGLTTFLLAAYSAYDHEERSLRRGRYFSSYPAHHFFGTQAMLYTADELEPLRKLIWRHGVENPEEPYDLLIKRRAIARLRSMLWKHRECSSSGEPRPHAHKTPDRPSSIRKCGLA